LITRLTKASAAVLALATLALSACSNQGSIPGSAGSPGAAPNAPQSAIGKHPRTASSSDFEWVRAVGAPGQKAVAQCRAGYTVIGGGSSSSDGSPVGDGAPDISTNSWVVTPGGSNVTAYSQASCASTSLGLGSFKWVAAANSNGLAGATCGAGYMLITGYGSNGVVKASWFNPDTNTFWISGKASAHASCAATSLGITIKHAWNQSQYPDHVFANCGTGNVVIAGSMGDEQWPGPPIQEHPAGGAIPSTVGDLVWYAFGSAANIVTWAACVPN